jgi:hypothetical protein
MKGFRAVVAKSWRIYRGWPRWAQITTAAIVVIMVIAAMASGGSESDSAKAAGSTKTVTENSSTEASKRAAAPATTTAPTTTAPKPPADSTVGARRRLTTEIDDALSGTNRDADPRFTLVYNPGFNIVVTWAINENLSEGLTKDNARREATDIVEAIRDAKLTEYTGATLEGTYPLVDKLGNASEERVVLASYIKDTIDGIHFDNFDLEDVFDPAVADSAQIHPAFRY